MNLAFIYLSGRLNRISELRKGFIPTEFFYGAVELEQRGHRVSMFEVVPTKRSSVGRFFAQHLIPQRFLPPKTFVGLYDSVRDVLRLLEGFDVVVATTPDTAFALAFWSACRGKLPVIVGTQCGILNYASNPIRKFWTKYFLERMYSQVYAARECEQIRKFYSLSDERIELNLFGIDTSFWFPKDAGHPEKFILSVGNDALRDYETLLKGAVDLSWPVTIVTKRNLPPALPANINWIKSSWSDPQIDDAGLRELYRKSSCVVVPVQTGAIQPSGQSVALQAMACAKPVVLAKTEGLWDDKGLRHGENIMFYHPGDTNDLVRNVRLLMENERLRQEIGFRSREYVLASGDINFFADRLERLCSRAFEFNK